MDSLPNYASPRYWDERYAATEGRHFEWYQLNDDAPYILYPYGNGPFGWSWGGGGRFAATQSFETLFPYIKRFLRRDDDFEIFVPGCGASEIGPKLYAAGYRNISCVDVSPVVIGWLQTAYADMDDMDFTVMDVAAEGSALEARVFDVAVDKGMLDSLLCDEDHRRAHAAVRNIFKSLKPGGVLLVVSHAPAEVRVGPLRGSDKPTEAKIPWSEIHMETLPKPELDSDPAREEDRPCDFLYICKKPSE